MRWERDYFHKPVLLNEAVDSLNLRSGGTYIDGTLGGGGHAREILRRISPGGLLIGIDLDENALARAREELEREGGKFILVKGNFSRMTTILAGLGIGKVDGILLDLGFSSLQLEDAGRGFSFMNEGPLDMRFDRQGPLSAHEIVNKYSEKKLKEVIGLYGEETMAGQIAKAIVQKRQISPIASTQGLSSLIVSALPRRIRTRRTHPATKTFQALRIAVNEELGNLSAVIPAGIELLNQLGRLSIISFHSLEDKIVKEQFNSFTGRCSCPPFVTKCACLSQAKIKIITKKSIKPSPEEIEANPRSRSARLRTAERI